MELPQILRFIFSPLIAFLITFYMIPFCMRIARRLSIIDIPDGIIKKHTHAIPYLGGVALYIGFIASLALLLPFNTQFLPFLLGATLLLFIGFIDDILIIKPYQKMGGQLVAALCFVKADVYLKEAFFAKSVWAIPLSLLWTALITNAFNLIDVMDGLSGTVALWSSFSFLVIALLTRQYDLVLLLSALIGSLLAFLWYNKPSAQIYLGDAGALFLGGLLSGIPFFLQWSSYTSHGLMAPLIIFAIPLLEVALLIIIRTYKGIPFYKGSPDHFSLYLLSYGWTKWHVLGYVHCASSLLLASTLLFVNDVVSLLGIVGVGILFLGVWVVIIFNKAPNLKLKLYKKSL